VREAFFEHYKDLKAAVVLEHSLDLKITHVPSHELEKTKGSGKLRRIVDLRL
jgi:hypothetical protein